jgi:hypothetical protein
LLSFAFSFRRYSARISSQWLWRSVLICAGIESSPEDGAHRAKPHGTRAKLRTASRIVRAVARDQRLAAQAAPLRLRNPHMHRVGSRHGSADGEAILASRPTAIARDC